MFYTWQRLMGENEKPGAGYVPAPGRFPGSDLLSRGVAPEVSSALKGLTTVFGMGTGGSPLL